MKTELSATIVHPNGDITLTISDDGVVSFHWKPCDSQTMPYYNSSMLLNLDDSKGCLRDPRVWVMGQYKELDPLIERAWNALHAGALAAGCTNTA